MPAALQKPPPPPPLAPEEKPHLPRAKGGRVHLGAMLLKAGLINEAKLDQALSVSKRENQRLGDVLIKSGFCRPEDISKALAQQFQVDFIEPRVLSIAMVERVAVLYRQCLIPITNLIHSKAKSRMQEFADAFKIRKD